MIESFHLKNWVTDGYPLYQNHDMYRDSVEKYCSFCMRQAIRAPEKTNMVRDRKNPLTDSNVGGGAHKQNESLFLHIEMHGAYRSYMDDSIIEWTTKPYAGGRGIQRWKRLSMIKKKGYCHLITGVYWGRGMQVDKFKIIVPVLPGIKVDLNKYIQKEIDKSGNSFLNIVEFLYKGGIISLTQDQLKAVLKDHFLPRVED